MHEPVHKTVQRSCETQIMLSKLLLFFSNIALVIVILIHLAFLAIMFSSDRGILVEINEYFTTFSVIISIIIFLPPLLLRLLSKRFLQRAKDKLKKYTY